MPKLILGDRVELNAKGMRYLKKKNSNGTIVGTNFSFIKVKFDSSAHEAEWFDPSWFIKTQEMPVSGL